MRSRLWVVGILAVSFLAGACAKSISQEQYIKVMSDLGCKLVMENSPGGQDILKADGVTPEDIQTFRKKNDVNTMIATAKEIATRVAACHGIRLP